MRVAVVEFEGIAIDQVPLTESLRVIEAALDESPVSSGVPIASLETIVIMKLLAGRSQDLADVEAIIASGVHRDRLRAAIEAALPDHLERLDRLTTNADRAR